MRCRGEQVKVGRERLKKPLSRSNFPPTSYNLGYDDSATYPLLSYSANVRTRDGASPRYDWQITLNKLHRTDGEASSGFMSFEDTHKVPRFGASHRGSVVQGPVSNWNLADEYRTNTARGFKFVRGSRPASPSSTAASVRTQSCGTNGNTRIGTFNRGEPVHLPATSMIDFQTRNLTEVCAAARVMLVPFL